MLGLIVMLTVFGISLADDTAAASTDLRAAPITGPCTYSKCAAGYHCINGGCVKADPCGCNCEICPIVDCFCACPDCSAAI
ncbi:hypothetical protein L596_013747 [Steinernema carpocapsae]|uniref:Antistasin-like domain-containing protein n=1 Tax=Steinernema carpocapsae TaxID=34508 RepID=A0A4U5P184_STECR|nr:hypothetical protein L596_013747 [Steinernema carpocapsae]